MSVALIHSKIYLRIATGILFILLIGFKMVAPVFIAPLSADKEFASNADDNSDKKSESNSSPEKEFYPPLHQVHNIPFLDSYVEHYTFYKVVYIAKYYQKIAIPPPDGISING